MTQNEKSSRRSFLRLATGVGGAAVAGFAGASLTEHPDYYAQAHQENKPDLLSYPYPEEIVKDASTWQRTPVNPETNVWNVSSETHEKKWYYGRHPGPFGKKEPLPPFEIGAGQEIVTLSRDSFPKSMPEVPAELATKTADVVEFFAPAEQQQRLDEILARLQEEDNDASTEISMTSDENTWFTINPNVKTVIAVTTDPIGGLTQEWLKKAPVISPLLKEMEANLNHSSLALIGSVFSGGITAVDATQETLRNKAEGRFGLTRRTVLGGIAAIFLGAGFTLRSKAQEIGRQAAASFNIESFLALKPNNPENPQDQLDVFWSKFSADLGQPPYYAGVLLRDLISVYVEKLLVQQGILIDTQTWGSEHEQQVGLQLLAEDEILSMIEGLASREGYGGFFKQYLTLKDFAASTYYTYDRNDSGNLVMSNLRFFAFPKLIAIFNNL